MHRNAEVLAIHADITVIEHLEHVVRISEQHFGKIDILFTNGPDQSPRQGCAVRSRKICLQALDHRYKKGAQFYETSFSD